MRHLTTLLAAALLASVNAYAIAGERAATPAAATSGVLADGEVRKVDKDAGKVTIKHGPLANLDMPAMTMVFRVKEPTMLDRVKAGDSIKFKADRVGGNYTVTELQQAK